MTLKTQWLGSFTLKGHSLYQVRDEAFINGKRYEDKALCLMPSKVWEEFFLLKKLFIG